MKPLRCISALGVSLIRLYEFRKNSKDHNTETLKILHEFSEFCRSFDNSGIGQVLSSSLPIQEWLNDILSRWLRPASFPPLTSSKLNGQDTGRVGHGFRSVHDRIPRVRTTNATVHDIRYSTTIPGLSRRGQQDDLPTARARSGWRVPRAV